jgi:hypothetical protein
LFEPQELHVIATASRALLALCALSLSLAAPSISQAKGKTHATPIHGTVLYKRTVQGMTGNCSCETQWYTVGLKKGKVTITIQLKKIAAKFAVGYGLRADLEARDHTVVAQNGASCLTKDKHCSVTVRLSAKVPSTGAYYVHIIGSGGEGMLYTIGVTGPQYLVS